MTRTSLDAVTLLYKHVKESELITGAKRVNGGLYKGKRPINSTKEDVVINSLPLNYAQLQEGVLNMNIYVRNLTLTLSGVTDNTQPDLARLSELTAIAIDFVREIDGPDAEYTFALQQDNLIEGDNNDHYVNLRIEFYSTNI
ncbi:hypothetical protein GCM10023149_48460 [Mucilaginibacter gynuensis]|uniref:Tail-completion protein n=1 Tax=Mucilaginibacter gynuensis TaxID=1302236 RepID=A0ABP8HF83_9SPHI